MTTDLAPKEYAVRVETPAGAFHVGGIAKGAGMIEPMLATMLAFLTTDARVPPALLQKALRRGGRSHVQRDHRRRRVLDERHAGRAGQRRQRRRHRRGHRTARSCQGSRPWPGRWRSEIVRGGEGATKLVAITVTGGESRDAAVRAAKTIANSPLVKTAVHGADPNWGRLVAAAGRSGARFAIDRATVRGGRRHALSRRPAVRRSGAAGRASI